MRKPQHDYFLGSSVKLTAFCCLLISMSLIFAASVPAQSNNPEENDAIELFSQGQDAHEKGDLKMAIELYEKALKSMPEFPEAELQRGKALLSLGRVEESEKAFRRSMELRDNWSLAYASLGSVLVRRNKFEEAARILKKAVELDPDNTPAWIANAELATRTNASDSELRIIYNKIAAMSKGAKPTAGVWIAKASLEQALNEAKAAEFSAARALEIDPKSISMLALLADAAIASRDHEKANDLIRRIGEIDPAGVELHALQVKLLVASGKPKEAIELIDSVRNASTELLEIRKKIAALTETETAVLEKQLEINPRNVVALGRLCTLLRKTEPLRAVEFCRRAADVEPNNIEHVIGAGGAMLQTKQYLQAVVLFQKLANIAPENYTVRANFATALFQLKRYNEAKVQFIWLTEKQPSNAAAYFFLAVSHDQLAEYADAMANYQLFLKFADAKINQLEIDKVNLRLPTLQKQLDSGKGRKNAKGKGRT